MPPRDSEKRPPLTEATSLKIVLQARNRNVIICAGADCAVDINEHVTASVRETKCAETTCPAKQTDGLRISIVPIDHIDRGIEIGVVVRWKTGNTRGAGSSRTSASTGLQTIGVTVWESPGVLGWRAEDGAYAIIMGPRHRRGVIAIVEIVGLSQDMPVPAQRKQQHR